MKILPVSDKFAGYCKEVSDKLKASGIRCDTDSRTEKVGYKIREAQLMKTPYMLILGANEAEKGTISIRSRNGETYECNIDDFIDKLKVEIANHK